MIGQIALVPYDSVEVYANGMPLANPWAGGMNCPQFSEIDLNEDGIKDLLTFERNFYGSVKTFINQGVPNTVSYRYAPEYQKRFPRLSNWMLLRDFDCDGKEDIFSSVPAGISVFRNTTEPGGKLKFTPVTTLLQTVGLDGTTPLYVSPPDIPAIVDVDNDGDLDVLSFEILGNTVEYHKNLAIENYGNCSVLEFELRNACWGYFSEDGNNNTVSLFDTCELNVVNPEKSAKHAGSTILALDLTGNGVKDLVLGDLTFNNLVEIINGGTLTSSGMVSFDPAFPSADMPVDITVFPAAFYLDVNNDAQKDLLVAPNNPNTSENINNIWFYQNISENAVPEFAFQQNNFLQEGMIDVGERSFATFFDEDADGRMDIVLGNFGYYVGAATYSSQLMLLRNTGTLSEAVFEVVETDYHNLSQFDFHGIYPAFGDMDGDGDEDMVTGDEDGALHYFRNDAGPGNPANFTLAAANYMGIDVGQSAKPQIIDVNRDGKYDLLVGERGGTINYFENTGTPELAAFTSLPTNDFFGSIDVMAECCTGYSTPCMVEDSAGNYQLYVGSEQGWLHLYNNIENNLSGPFNKVDSLYLNAVNINPSLQDLNGDGRPEMVFGQEGGGLGLLTYGIPDDLGIRKQKNPGPNFTVFPNPATGSITLEMKNPAPFFVRIVNSMGQEVFAQAFRYTGGTESLDLRSIPKGIFFIQVESPEGQGTRKLILK